MVTISNVADRILTENNYVVGDFGSLTNVEYLIDNAVDYINLEAGVSIANLSGTEETKSLTATAQEIVVVKLVSGLLLRAFKDKGPAVTVQGLSVSMILTDPHYQVFTKLMNSAINRLRGRSFVTT